MLAIPPDGAAAGQTDVRDAMLQLPTPSAPHPPRASMQRPGLCAGLLIAGVALGIAACQPTVQVAAPKEPITINLNVKLDADVRVRLEEKARQDIQTNPDIF